MDDLLLPFGENFKQAWSEWLQYRKENKFKKYVPTGIKRTLTGLVRDSGDNEQTAIAIIHQSIEKGYQGLFPLKQIYGINSNTTKQQPGTSDARIAAAKNF